MAKWADYVITSVRFNRAGSHIAEVQYCADNGDSLGARQQTTRAGIISSLKGGATFVTAPPDRADSSKVVQGATVGIVVVAGEEFIRTDRDQTKSDNLDNLPRF